MVQKKFRSIRKEILVQYVFFLGILRETFFFGFRGVYCSSNWLTKSGPCDWYNVQHELALLVFGLLLVILELVWERDWEGLWQTIRSNWLVFCFVGLGGLSLLWSVHITVTLYRSLILLSITFLAIYIGHIFGLKKLIKSLTWFYVGLCFLSLIIAIFFPENNIMPEPHFKGAWSGVFFHRNYLGAFMALGVALCLVNLLSNEKPRRGYFYLNIVMLAVISFLLLKSKSATGAISALILVVLTLVLFAWIKWGQNLKPIQYFGFLGAALIIFIVMISNLDFILGIFGRNITFTGRVPVWKYLFQNVISQRPWLGYGYGAIWHLKGFIRELIDVFNWGVVLGDNGYVDILLHLGIFGITILLALIIMGFIRGIRYFLQVRNIMAAFPILVLVFGVVANISLSLILETETLVWIIAVATLVSIGAKYKNNSIVING